MSVIDEIKNDKRRYQRLKERLQTAVSKLNPEKEKMEKTSVKVKDYYSIDELSGDNKELIRITASIDNVINKINKSIIPSINVKMDNLNNDIDKALAEEETRLEALKEKNKEQ